MCWEKIRKFLFRDGEQPDPRFIGKSILAIDDDMIQRTMIEKTLQKRGFSVMTAENGEVGLDMAVNNKPDVILLDVILPGMRGYEVCRRLKKDERTKDIPILFLTALDDPKEVIAQYDMGGEVHLSKPINPRELISQIEISLQERKIV